MLPPIIFIIEVELSFFHLSNFGRHTSFPIYPIGACSCFAKSLEQMHSVPCHKIKTIKNVKEKFYINKHQ